MNLKSGLIRGVVFGGRDHIEGGPLKNILISYFSKIFFFIFQNEPPSLTFGYTLVFVTACLTLIVCLTGKYKFHPRRRIVSLKSLSSSLTSSFIKA